MDVNAADDRLMCDVDRSSSKVALMTWTRVTISRRGRDGTLQVNDDEPTVGRSRGPATQLNLPMTLYVGGLPVTADPASGVTAGFIGAIQRVGEIHCEITFVHKVSVDLYSALS